jgi:Predicted transcriptional regulators
MFVSKDAYKTLKKIRNKKRISGTELSKRMGLTPQHLWNIENHQNRLTLEYAYMAAKALDVPVQKFCDEIKQNV